MWTTPSNFISALDKHFDVRMTQRILKWLGLAGASVLALALTLLLAAWGAANTQTGRTWIEDTLESALSSGGTTARVTGLTGPIPQRIGLKTVNLNNADGDWFTLHNAELMWQPLALLRGRLDIARLKAARITLKRLPPGAETSSEPEPADTRLRLPDIPVSIRLERVAIERVELGAPVLGQAATLTVDGEMAAPVAGEMRTRLAIERLDAPGGNATLDARYTPADRVLDLSAALQGAAGGFLAGALDLPADAAVSAELSGTGPIDAWNGRFTAKLGPDASADIGLRLRGRRRLKIDGTAAIAPLLPAPAPALLGGPLEIAAALSRTADGAALTIDQARVTSPTTDLRVKGRYDTRAGTVSAEADVNVTDPGALNALATPLRLTGFRLQAKAEGPMLAPKLDLTATAKQVSVPEASLQSASLNMGFKPDGALDRGDLTARLESGRLDLAAPALSGLSGAPLSLNAKARLNGAAGRITDARVAASVREIAATLSKGQARLDGTQARANYSLTAANLAPLEPLLGQDIAGRGRLNGKITLTADADPMLTARLDGQFRELAWASLPELNAVVGGSLDLGAELAMTPDGALQLRDFAVESRAAQIAGNLEVSADFAGLDGAFTGRVPDLSALEGLAGIPLQGDLTLDAALSGPLANPALAARIESRNTVAAAKRLGTVSLDATLTDLASGLNGPLALSVGESPLGSVKADLELALTGTGLTLRAGSLTAPGAKVSSLDLTIPLDGGAMTGGARLESANLGELRPLADAGRSGALDARLTLESSETGQTLQLDGTLKALRAANDSLRVNTIELTGRMGNVFAAPEGQIEAALSGVVAGDAKVPTANITVSGGLQDAAVTLDAEGDFFGPLSLAAKARIQQGENRLEATLAQLDATVQGRDLRLARPATIVQDSDGLRLRDLVVVSDDGTLSLTATRTTERIDATLQADTLPLNLANLILAEPPLTGVLDATVNVSGPLDAPEARWDIAARNVVVKETDLPPLAATISGSLDGGQLATNGRVTGLSETPVTLTAALPMRLSLAPVAVTRPENEAMNVAIDWRGDVAPLMPFIPVSGHRLGGQADIALKLGGTWAAPAPSGTITLENGVYENLDAGTLLTDITARIEADGQSLRIAEFNAKDGADGRVSLDGGLDIGGPQGTVLDLKARSKEAVLLRRDEIKAATNTDLSVAGPLNDLAVTGKVKVVRGEARIPDTMPPQVADLNVTEVGGDRPPPAQGTQEDSDSEKTADGGNDSDAGRVSLDIGIEIPNRMFLRGRGLDTEWAGNLTVTGTAAVPAVQGQLTAVRGRIDALGKSFQLDSGTVTFDGGDDIDPIVDITAIYTSTDLNVTVNVAGTGSNPEITLGSQPDLPRDEILARLLFGKQATELSGVEAAQLAAALAELSGATGGGPGILDRVRQAVGVDVLQLGGGAGGSSVRAGEYLGEDVFVGVEQGLGAESSKVTVEVGITDNIAVESNVGATGESNVGLQFKWDY